MCATSGGGFALMTEAVAWRDDRDAVVCIDVQRAGPATAADEDEQGDLWQVLGAGQGDFRESSLRRRINSIFISKTIPELFNLCDKYNAPARAH